jgi:glycosyltransferase involved in cell wall biosynthesis
VEAQACGTPVLATAIGEPLDNLALARLPAWPATDGRALLCYVAAQRLADLIAGVPAASPEQRGTEATTARAAMSGTSIVRRPR